MELCEILCQDFSDISVNGNEFSRHLDLIITEVAPQSHATMETF